MVYCDSGKGTASAPEEHGAPEILVPASVDETVTEDFDNERASEIDIGSGSVLPQQQESVTSPVYPFVDSWCGQAASENYFRISVQREARVTHFFASP